MKKSHQHYRFFIKTAWSTSIEILFGRVPIFYLRIVEWPWSSTQIELRLPWFRRTLHCKSCGDKDKKTGIKQCQSWDRIERYKLIITFLIIEDLIRKLLYGSPRKSYYVEKEGLEKFNTHIRSLNYKYFEE